MYNNDFEAAFSNFLERHEYDEAESYLFSMVRIAFAAGWRGATRRGRSGFSRCLTSPMKRETKTHP